MADSFRITPAPSPQQAAETATAAWDEMTDQRGQVRPHWQNLSVKIQRWSTEERHSIASSAARMIADLGTTFNVYSDVGGVGQPYELDPVPLLVSPADWAQVSAGLAQRIRLIDAILTDLYGPQELLREGLVPPDLVNSSSAFHQYARGIQPAGGHFVVTTGCDLVRSSTGQWTVLRDHTGTPGGLGQVLENRNVTSSLLSDQFEALRIARLGSFFNLERQTLQSLLPSRGDMPNVVFLTPGFRHPSYFEHAYKARLLGFPLVEPADLTVRERRLFLKTLSGLRRIDVVGNRIEDDGLDPLEHWGQGGGGVPGVVEAWRTGNVAMANAPGASFASTAALMPFLPGICRKWFGEEIKLPFVETR
ncbi:MAG: molybdopterin oxidoreductase, partial [Verrucomicrobiaceae bacterium]